jgi:hypothetical protein
MGFFGAKSWMSAMTEDTKNRLREKSMSTGV